MWPRAQKEIVTWSQVRVALAGISLIWRDPTRRRGRGVRGSDLSGRSLAPVLRQEDGLSESNASDLPTAPSANPWRRGKSCLSPTRQARLLDGRAVINSYHAQGRREHFRDMPTTRTGGVCASRLCSKVRPDAALLAAEPPTYAAGRQPGWKWAKTLDGVMKLDVDSVISG